MQADADAEKLVRDVRVVLQDAENLIKATSGMIGEEAREARARLAGALLVARDTVEKIERETVASAQKADRMVRENPYQAIGVAFGVGMVLGFLIARRL
jgi:ElaB/YqjD/DUF883 family membrane-anchored ribosome-binding protein